MTAGFIWHCEACPMLPDSMTRHLRILGDGCAALSLAARADELPDHDITLVRPSGAPAENEHIWGFWGGAGLERAVGLARAGGLGLPPARAMLRIVFATAVLAVVLLLGSEMTAGLSRTASLAILVTGGGVIYLVAAALSGAVPWHLLRR